MAEERKIDALINQNFPEENINEDKNDYSFEAPEIPDNLNATDWKSK